MTPFATALEADRPRGRHLDAQLRHYACGARGLFVAALVLLTASHSRRRQGSSRSSAMRRAAGSARLTAAASPRDDPDTRSACLARAGALRFLATTGSPMSNETDNATRVIVTDIHMPFWSMVRFMVKWTIAAIPAIVILVLVSAVLSALLGGLFTSIQNRKTVSVEMPERPAMTQLV
jgi:hypothetical protein